MNQVDTNPEKVNLRSHIQQFEWKTSCFFCGNSVVLGVDQRHPDRTTPVHRVTMLHFKVSILNRCNLRKDAWATEVERRVSGCIDLVASEAVYHDTCKTRFFSDKSLSAKVDIFKTPEQKKPGRPQNNEMQASFKHLCQWLEEQTELYTVAELYDKICSM